MATQKTPYWNILLGSDEQAVVLNACLHVAGSPEGEYFDFKKSVPAMSNGVVRLTMPGMVEAEAAIDNWVMDKTPPAALAKEAHRLCCRLQHIGRCEPNGYNEVEVPPAKPTERQISLFGTEQEGM